MKFISKISKQGEDYFIRIPRDEHYKLDSNDLHGPKLTVEIRRAID